MVRNQTQATDVSLFPCTHTDSATQPAIVATLHSLPFSWTHFESTSMCWSTLTSSHAVTNGFVTYMCQGVLVPRKYCVNVNYILALFLFVKYKHSY